MVPVSHASYEGYQKDYVSLCTKELKSLFSGEVGAEASLQTLEQMMNHDGVSIIFTAQCLLQEAQSQSTIHPDSIEKIRKLMGILELHRPHPFGYEQESIELKQARWNEVMLWIDRQDSERVNRSFEQKINHTIALGLLKQCFHYWREGDEKTLNNLRIASFGNEETKQALSFVLEIMAQFRTSQDAFVQNRFYHLQLDLHGIYSGPDFPREMPMVVEENSLPELEERMATSLTL